MAKKVLIISGSPRKNGNTQALCDNFYRGAAEAGNEVEMISLSGKKIGFCTACYACHNGACPQHDDAPEIVQKMLGADVIVLATPVYFYTMSAQLKALIDRSVMVYPKIEKKEFFFLMAMADTEEKNFLGTVEALRGFAACCENSVERGIISAAGVYEAGEIAGHPALLESYEAGKSIC